jgi:hypothetical protein
MLGEVTVTVTPGAAFVPSVAWPDKVPVGIWANNGSANNPTKMAKIAQGFIRPSSVRRTRGVQGLPFLLGTATPREIATWEPLPCHPL